MGTTATLEDLIEKAHTGDTDALATVCEQVYPKVLKYITYRVGAEPGEDLANEVIIRVMHSATRQKGSFNAWLYRIAANVVADYYRLAKRRRERPLEENRMTALGVDPAHEVARRLDLQSAIGRLTEDQRELVILKFTQGLSNEDISEITGRSLDAIRGLQFRALSALREILDHRGEL